ncbi:Scr1 family TA system antitoxin-like transcriptional regulator [Streptomyces syringium]|uniref:Scr1 family TA system antitoxin-like transcriptional regulator n=1 Tax=Streptomyces syringium TaxID=76729 RepID=UPI003AAED294
MPSGSHRAPTRLSSAAPRTPWCPRAEAAVPQLDTVQTDSTHRPEFVYGEAQLSKYRAQLDWMERLALEPEDSRRFIRDLVRQL